MCTRAQGLFAHATTPGVPTIIVTQTKAARYKNICASEPENVCTLLAASPTKSARWYSPPILSSKPTKLEAINEPIFADGLKVRHSDRCQASDTQTIQSAAFEQR